VSGKRSIDAVSSSPRMPYRDRKLPVLATLLLAVLTATGAMGGRTAMAATTEGRLPAGVVNTAREEFGDKIGGGSDYGQANLRPVEVVSTQDGAQEIRVMRTPRELHLSRSHEAHFQVLMGNVKVVYFWIEAPRTHGQWHTSLTAIHPDGFRKVILDRDIRNRVVQFAYVEPGTSLEVRISTVEHASSITKHFFFTLSPIITAIWPDYLPTPFKSLWN